MAPRLFGIPATRAPIVAVLRRGPTAWSHIGRWDVATGRYEPGAWIRATLYPQRCDLSPDGRWLCYFTLKGRARWSAGMTYVAIARLPWLTALAAWATCGTWSRGAHFVEDPEVWQVGEPSEGDVAGFRGRLGLAVTRPATFAVERRRGWTETADTPVRSHDDVWDERRAERVRVEKAQPGSGGGMRLVVQGWYAAFRSGGPQEVLYGLVDGGREQSLDDIQWADWTTDGQLLVATTDGRLQIREWARGEMVVHSEVDLAGMTPAPAPPPAEARLW
jgi:hypothetical protein